MLGIAGCGDSTGDASRDRPQLGPVVEIAADGTLTYEGVCVSPTRLTATLKADFAKLRSQARAMNEVRQGLNESRGVVVAREMPTNAVIVHLRADGEATVVAIKQAVAACRDADCYWFAIEAGDKLFVFPQPPAQPESDACPAVFLVRLAADDNGSLASIRHGDDQFARWQDLRESLIYYVGPDTGPNSQRANAFICFECDERLRCKYPLQALNEVTQYEEDGKRISLFRRVFHCPRPKAGFSQNSHSGQTRT
jgi:hypothetical protein